VSAVRAEGVPSAPTVRVTAPDVRQRTNPLTAETRWWHVFGDPVLNQLCETAGRDNDRIRVAAARSLQARARAAEATSVGQPHLEARLSATDASGPLINAAGGNGRLLEAGASLSWELDLLHRIGDGRRAARLDARAEAQLAGATRLLVLAEVSETYFEIRHLDALRRLAAETAEAYAASLALTEGRLASGSVAELDVERARLELAEVQADQIRLEETRQTRVHALAVLTGTRPEDFQLAETTMAVSLPAIPTGLPSTLLTRRPDVAAMQLQLDATQLRAGIAHHAWFPNFGMTGTGGFASSSLSDLLATSAQSWTVGLLLGLPILDGGQNKARIALAEAEVTSQTARYRQTLLTSLAEVADQLVTLQSLTRQDRLRRDETAAASRAEILARSRFDRGMASQLDVLDAQRSALKARRAVLEVHSRQRLATVRLIRALGGGWDVAANETGGTAS
jgi:multidrug efflux system outer membrane protein